MDVETPGITDVPYEAAIAAFGALFAGLFGVLASYCKRNRPLRIIYAILSSGKFHIIFSTSPRKFQKEDFSRTLCSIFEIIFSGFYMFFILSDTNDTYVRDNVTVMSL